MTKHQERQVTFEEALSELEEIAEKLERGQLTLEDSINAYEKGMDLKKICLDRLKSAEGKIEYLAKNADGKVVKENAKKEKDVKEEILF